MNFRLAYKRLQRVTRGTKGLQEVTKHYRSLQGVNMGHKVVTVGYMRLQGVTGG